MPQVIYSVFQEHGRWTLEVNRKQRGPFNTERDALRIAIETAQEAGRYHPEGAQVLLMREDEMSRIVWTYGIDPYPPTKFE